MRAILLSPAVLLFAAACRLLIISNYDTTTATTITVAGGFTNTLLGTLVPLLPPFLPAITVGLLIFRRFTFAALSALATALVSPAYASAASGWLRAQAEYSRAAEEIRSDGLQTLMHSPWLFFCVALGALFVYYEPPPFVFTRKGWLGVALFVPEVAPLFIYSIAVAATCSIAFFFVQTVYQVPFNSSTFSEVVRRPWLPAESIRLKSNEIRVGYTLSISNGWLMLLNESDRTVDFIPAGDAVARTICKPGLPIAAGPSPLIKVEGAHPVTPRPCPPPAPKPQG